MLGGNLYVKWVFISYPEEETTLLDYSSALPSLHLLLHKWWRKSLKIVAICEIKTRWKEKKYKEGSGSVLSLSPPFLWTLHVFTTNVYTVHIFLFHAALFLPILKIRHGYFLWFAAKEITGCLFFVTRFIFPIYSIVQYFLRTAGVLLIQINNK